MTDRSQTQAMNRERLMELRKRVAAQTARRPLVEQYFPAELEFAIVATLEGLEEQEYHDDPHVWCHGRPEMLTLLQAVLNGR